ncbi:MAG: type IV pilus twitching motility protein PilT [Oligoflexales bacterium]|nr:type IV pilus twitching motility protein PilT [Oligoflexales bacterium]
MEQLKQIIKLALQTQADKISLRDGRHPIYYIKGEKKEANHLPILDLQLINEFFSFLYPDEKNMLVRTEPTENILSISPNLKLKVLAWNNQLPWIYLYFPNGEWLFQRDFQKSLKDMSEKSIKPSTLSLGKIVETAPPPPPMLHLQQTKIEPFFEEKASAPDLEEQNISLVENSYEPQQPAKHATNLNGFSLNGFSVYEEQTEIQGIGAEPNHYGLSPVPKIENKKQDTLNINFFAPPMGELAENPEVLEEKIVESEKSEYANEITLIDRNQIEVPTFDPPSITVFDPPRITAFDPPNITPNFAPNIVPSKEAIPFNSSSVSELEFTPTHLKTNIDLDSLNTPTTTSFKKEVEESFATSPIQITATDFPHEAAVFQTTQIEKKLTVDFSADKEGLSHGDHAIDKLLKQMIEIKASDLHLTNGQPIILRVDGDIKRVSDEQLNDDQMQKYLFPIMPLRNQEEFAINSDTDFAYEVAGTGRFRVNMFRDRNGVGAVLRHIPSKILSFDELKLPATFKKFCDLSKGLVLVTGPTGSGKSTTLAAMLDLINTQKKTHIITIEDPIEFVHPQKSALINQREIGRHTKSFSRALRAALREDPDIVLIGEMRDLETIAIAIETAETGHLVFGTLHTNTAISTVDRIIDQFPPEQQNQIRMMLSASLKGVISQTLVKKKGGGRIAAYETLVVDDAIAANIREGKTHMIGNMMTTQRAAGNQMLNDALLTLIDAGSIEVADAYIKCVDKKDFINKAERRNLKIPGLTNGQAA